MSVVRKVAVLVLVALLGFSGNAFALGLGWVGGPAGMDPGFDSAWENPINWWDYTNGGHKDPATADVFNTGWAGYLCDAYVSSNVVFNELYLGSDTHSDVTINSGASMDGTILTIVGSRATGHLTVNGSFIQNNGVSIGALLVGDGTIHGVTTVNEGGLVDVTWLWMARGAGTGLMEIDGTTHVRWCTPLEGQQEYRTASLWFGETQFTGGAGKRIDIEGGQLVLDNFEAPWNYWINKISTVLAPAGNVTAYDGAGTLQYQYNPGTNQTIVTAIPEPASLLLLGIGGLLLRRKRV